MFSSSKFSPSRFDSSYGFRSFDVPIFSAYHQCPRPLGWHIHSEASAPYFLPAGHMSSNDRPPISFSQDTHQPGPSNEVPIYRIQRLEGPSIPSYTQSTPQYASMFFPNQESQSVPRLRPASWGSGDEEFEDCRPTRSKPADFREDPSGKKEGLPSNKKNPSPLIIPHGSWRLGARTTSDASNNLSCEPTSDSGHVSATSKIPTAPFFSNCLNEIYR